jgi:hypothetical protein
MVGLNCLGRPTLVDYNALSSLIEGMLKLNVSEDGSGKALAKNFIHVINAHDTPRWDYDPHQKLFSL